MEVHQLSRLPGEDEARNTNMHMFVSQSLLLLEVNFAKKSVN